MVNPVNQVGPPKPRRKTAREIAEKVGLSIRTVQRHISRPRAEYLANSISRAKPWEAFGISRATWYNRGKPAPPELKSETAAAKTKEKP